MSGKIFVWLLATVLLSAALPAEAQQPTKIFRIGFLDSSTASGSAVLVEAFRQEIRKLGWIEGKNIAIEYRFAEQKNERLSELAADLVRLKVDLIVVAGTVAALAAKSATTTIPIVMANAGDPVGAGLVASLARPGGNVTGLEGLGPQLNTKRLEVLKDAVPKLARVGLLLGSGANIGSGVRPIDWREKQRIRGRCDRPNQRVGWTREKESINGKTTTEI
jgi:putative ABC transport system substrate-binding protein